MSKAPKPDIKKVQTLLLEVVDTNRLLREKMLLEGWRAAITVGTNDGPLTGLSNRY